MRNEQDDQEERQRLLQVLETWVNLMGWAIQREQERAPYKAAPTLRPADNKPRKRAA